jgi:hypothetical protein
MLGRQLTGVGLREGSRRARRGRCVEGVRVRRPCGWRMQADGRGRVDVPPGSSRDSPGSVEAERAAGKPEL